MPEGSRWRGIQETPPIKNWKALSFVPADLGGGAGLFEDVDHEPGHGINCHCGLKTHFPHVDHRTNPPRQTRENSTVGSGARPVESRLCHLPRTYQGAGRWQGPN